jgi:3'-phosphoadenosine 5'-phosphosulfate sulfotransferase (PAPS reductase)/FAD synthetase
MVQQLSTDTAPAIIYPESDGQPMADNTKQFRLIVVIKENPRLGVKFQVTSDNLEIFYPSGDRFLTFVELAQLKEQEKQRAEQEKQRADEAIAQLEQERSLREREQQRYQALMEKLREQGIDPEKL